MGIVLFGALITFFFPFIGAYKWYRGEKHTVEDYSVRPLPSLPTLSGQACTHGCMRAKLCLLVRNHPSGWLQSSLPHGAMCKIQD